MNFSTQWDDRFKENTHISTWPWSDLVSYVMRYTNVKKSNLKVLELGCGAGANIPFFVSLNVDYYGIDGSPTIISVLKEKFPKIEKKLMVGDFTENIPFEETFDLIVDRSAVTSNTTEAIKNCLNLIYEKLNPEGKYIGIDLFSTMHSEYQRGERSEDDFTKTNFKDGPFVGLGRIHFFDRPHLIELFKKFEIQRLEHKVSNIKIPDEGYTYAAWNLLAKKLP